MDQAIYTEPGYSFSSRRKALWKTISLAVFFTLGILAIGWILLRGEYYRQQASTLREEKRELEEMNRNLKTQFHNFQQARLNENPEAAQLEQTRQAVNRLESVTGQAKETLLAQISQTLKTRLAELVPNQTFILTAYPSQITVRFPEEFFFDADFAGLSNKGNKFTLELAKLFNGEFKDLNIRTEAYTGQAPLSRNASRNYPSHWEFTSARAASIARCLNEKGSVDKARLSAAGMGNGNLIDQGQSEEAEIHNRRIELVLTLP